MPTRPNLFDRIREQAKVADALMGGAHAADPTSLDPAVSAAHHARRDAEAAAVVRERKRRSDGWLRTMLRLLPPDVRDQARLLVSTHNQAQVRMRTLARRDLAAWRLANREQIAGMRRLLDAKQVGLDSAKKATEGLVEYVTRVGRHAPAEAKPKARHPYAAELSTWRADPDMFHAFLKASAETPMGIDPRVDLARQVSARRSTLAARQGAKRATKSRWERKRAANRLHAERMMRAINLQNDMRPKERTKAGERMRQRAPDMAAFHSKARSTALVREFRCWNKAYGLVGAKQFALRPTSIDFAASKGQARIIGHGGVDVTSPETIHASLASQGAWAGCAGRKPFRADALVEHFILSLPAGYQGDDVDEQLLYQAHRKAARVGFDLSRHAHVISRHHDTDHHHVHLLVNRIRDDGAVVQMPSAHAWRALAIDRDVSERQFQRVNHLDEVPTFHAIGGFDAASRASSLALEKGKAQGSIVHLDGSTRETYELYGQGAANRCMRVGYQADEALLPSGFAKVVSHNPSLDAEMSDFENLILYVLRIR